MEWTQHAHAADAVADLCARYERAVATARGIVSGSRAAGADDWRAVTYPTLAVDVRSWQPIDRTEPFGYVDRPGRYQATVSRPAIMADYFTTQLSRLCANYPCSISVGDSGVRIPPEYLDLSGIDDADATVARLRSRSGGGADPIPRPSLDDVDDAIIDGAWAAFHGGQMPLFHFTPQRFDIACERISHYTGIPADGVQKYILFTNYAMHTREFVDLALARLTDPASRYTALVLPDATTITRRQAAQVCAADLDTGSTRQMPRFDLVADANTGITMINIGVGPSNAKTITDCLAVLRPECWIMIGHCAGLDARMRMGDLILGNAYQRRDHILDEHIAQSIPIPAVPEVQRALEKSVRHVYSSGQQLMRTGTVMSTDDRNWEWNSRHRMWELLRGSTAVAVDMESATLAANGYRYRVPYGTLLSVSDLPLHDVPKLPAAAQSFYASSKQAHVQCAMHAVEKLAKKPSKLHTRKLRRTIAEVPFR
ncbi:AMP nucleosidase [Corynebacterium mendelii]|uniref:AMP nucleosidase n=1 Tax=Corynebacterium mendelii TaxID=2765362 RepID=A0A939E0R5_9CORY|nr:AMP nucleosidase [Corynebacterium mendelii]MBN9644325.1 AMP nucleosidase [Corynebacterium mendelii]